MHEKTVVVLGLPNSGKTTYLAALWHQVSSREIPTALRFHTLNVGEAEHLHAISTRWRLARQQDHTPLGSEKRVVLSLLGEDSVPLRIMFPDVGGEAFGNMWEERQCDPQIAEYVRAGSVLLFVNADNISAPRYIVEDEPIAAAIGLPTPDNVEVKWSPHISPTQVQLLDLLQLLRQPPLDIGPRRLAVLLSAWDSVEKEGLSPTEFFAQRLPLLHQYLSHGADSWTWRVYGLSAQGGEYDARDGAERVEEAAMLREMNLPSLRVRLTTEAGRSSDLTEPVAWLVR